MDKIAELRAERAKKADSLELLNAKMSADGYELDEADEAAFNEIEQEIKAIDKRIDIAERTAKIKASLAKPVDLKIANAGTEVRSNIILPGRSSLKNFKGERAAERAYRFGKFMMASIYGHEKSVAWCNENGIPLQKAHSEGVNAQGGVFVPEEFSNEIIDLRDQYGVFRRLCKVIPMGRDTITQPRRTGGLTAYAVGEATAITQSTTAWDNIRLTANKWGVLTLMSTELDEDAAVAIGDLLVGEIAYAFAVAEDTAGFSGDGTSTYHGIRGFLTKMGADQITAGASTLAGCVDAASGHDTFGEIDATDLANLMAKLPQYVYRRGNVRFYASQYAWGATFQRLIQSAGGISKDDITGSVVYRYLGFEVEIVPSMPAVGTDLSDQAMILFGDIGMAATMGDRRGMTVARSTEYKFAEDQVAIKGTERFDINIHDIGSTTTPGPVVALIGE